MNQRAFQFTTVAGLVNAGLIQHRCPGDTILEWCHLSDQHVTGFRLFSIPENRSRVTFRRGTRSAGGGSVVDALKFAYVDRRHSLYEHFQKYEGGRRFTIDYSLILDPRYDSRHFSDTDRERIVPVVAYIRNHLNRNGVSQPKVRTR